MPGGHQVHSTWLRDLIAGDVIPHCDGVTGTSAVRALWGLDSSSPVCHDVLCPTCTVEDVTAEQSDDTLSGFELLNADGARGVVAVVDN